MSDITLKDITSGYNFSRITYNFQVLQNVINKDILHLVGGNNTMRQDLDMNSNQILNAHTDPSNPGSLVTLGFADNRYLKVDGSSTMKGNLNMGGKKITNLGVPTASNDAVRKTDLDKEADIRARSDMVLQRQISGGVPLASPFSVISWHDQVVDGSIEIPANKNAWSFGPSITIEDGVVVSIGENSHWTVANGAVYE